jgi:U3 small nucleolar RNA-associated protein 5
MVVPCRASVDNRVYYFRRRLLENEAAVLVAHGTSVKPHFEKVSLSGQEGLSITLNSSAEGALLPAGAAVNKTGTASVKVTVLGPDNAGEATMARPQIDIASAKKKTKKRRAETEDEEAQPSVKPSEDKVDVQTDSADTVLTVVPDDEQTLEEKLIALKIIEEGDAKDHNEDAQEFDKGVVPRADSLQVLLSQALKAEDNALLEQCLNVGDEKVILNTIRRLRPFEAAKFLSVAVSKMEGRPQRALGLVPWVRAVLLQHASFVMTNLAMQPVLTTLYQIIETRLSVFRPLLSLSGRLDLIMAQIQKNESQGKEDQQQEAAVVYEEEADEPEALDVMVDGGSQYDLEDEEDEDSESGDEDEDDDMGDDDEMDEDEPDIKLNGNGNGMSDGEDEDI